MFIRINPRLSRYTRDGEQRAGGAFIVLVTCPDPSDHLGIRCITDAATGKPALRAIVRSVKMRQSGHYMFGYARVGALPMAGGERGSYRGSDGATVEYQTPGRYLSGSYGSDGLPLSDAGLFALSVPLPPDVAAAFWSGGGHNSSGAEGPALRAWALENERRLRQAGRRRP